MDVLFVIRRYLWTRRIALVATLLVALAVCAMIVITAVMDGFRGRIHRDVRGVEPDLAFRVRGTPPAQHFAAVADELRGEMAEAGGPIAALSPRLFTVGFVIARPGGSGAELKRGIELIGIDYEREREVIQLRSILEAVDDPRHRPRGDLDEDPLTAKQVPGVFVGEPVARRLRLTTDSRPPEGFAHEVTVLTGRMVPDPDRPGEWRLQEANATFRVAGVFSTGRDEFDLYHAFLPLGELMELRYGPDSTRPDCTTVHARLVAEARRELDRWTGALDRAHARLEVASWKDRNRGLMVALDVEKATMTLVLAVIVVFSVGLILGLLYLMVVEKTRDIGVLRSMGMSGRRVVLLFFGYGTVLGGIGAVLGTVLGIAAVRNLNELIDLLGIEPFSRDVPYRFRDLPAVLDGVQVARIAVLALLLAMVAGALAAWRASRVDPIRCLRYE